jgi:hypothetical protein
MSSSPAGEAPPLDPDEAEDVEAVPDDADADLEYAALLVRDTVAAPRLVVLDGPAVDADAGELPTSSSASRRLGRREPKLRRRCAAVVAAAVRPAMEVRIHRVALKLSRKRTFFTAVRSVPRSDAGRFSLSGSAIGSIGDRIKNATSLVPLVPRFWMESRRYSKSLPRRDVDAGSK